MLKQLKYFWNLPKNQLGTILEQISLKVSKETSHCFLDFCAFAHVEAVEVILDNRKSVGHPSGAALHAGRKGDGLLLPGFLALARVEAAEVLLVTQKSGGRPSGAALHAGLKGDGPLLLEVLGLCALKQ